MNQVPGKGYLLSVYDAHQADGPQGMAGSRMDLQFAGSPAVSVVVAQNAGHWHIVRQAEEVVLDVVHFENTAIPPEVLRIIEKVPFMLRDNDRNPLGRSAKISLAL